MGNSRASERGTGNRFGSHAFFYISRNREPYRAFNRIMTQQPIIGNLLWITGLESQLEELYSNMNSDDRSKTLTDMKDEFYRTLLKKHLPHNAKKYHKKERTETKEILENCFVIEQGQIRVLMIADPSFSVRQLSDLMKNEQFTSVIMLRPSTESSKEEFIAAARTLMLRFITFTLPRVDYSYLTSSDFTAIPDSCSDVEGNLSCLHFSNRNNRLSQRILNKIKLRDLGKILEILLNCLFRKLCDLALGWD